MQVSGNLKKMRVTLNSPVKYIMTLGDKQIDMNALLNKKISIQFSGQINCIQCGRKTNKSFQQGYCFPCLRQLQECDLCIIHPERCQVEKGVCDQTSWAHQQCAQPHVVYLANSSGLKVGVTREANVPSRWIDQGAIQAMPIYKTTNRYQAGLLEVVLKKYVSDRTNWRNMLKNNVIKLNLLRERERILGAAKDDITRLLVKYQHSVEAIEHPEIVSLIYPVQQYPSKIVSLSLDKTPDISDILLGIKGQYLIFDSGVLNIRKFGGYQVKLKVAV